MKGRMLCLGVASRTTTYTKSITIHSCEGAPYNVGVPARPVDSVAARVLAESVILLIAID